MKMNSVEPSGVLYSRLSCLDPESASKIMGFILIHGPNEADMMSLATAPDALLRQLISRGKNYSTALTTSSPTPSSTSKPSPSYAAAVVNGNGSFGGPTSAACDRSKSGGAGSFHKRSLSLSDAYDPWKFDGFEQQQLLQQRLALASQIMSGASKCLSDTPRSKAAAMMMGEDAYKLGQFRNDMVGCNAGSRQIYLTFPADSTFREEDVSNYFSIYGPVHDVRIPYQQKRMFGFVTFVHPESVNIVLAKGNPHFVCDSQVLVKPYKEKGKVDKKHLMTQQQLERGDFSSCSSPHGVDIRDIDVPIGPRMFYNNTLDLLMRRKLEEQAEFQQALEMQSRKMANLQLLDLKNLSGRHPFSPDHNLSPAAAISSPTHHPLLSPNYMGSFNQEAYEDKNIIPTLSLPPHTLGNRQNSLEGYSNVNNCNEYITSNTNKVHIRADLADNESVDLVLPDTLDDTTLSRPAAPSHQSIFSSAMLAMNEKATATNSQFSSNSSTIVSSVCLSNVALPKSSFLDDPSFGAAGNRAIEM